MKKVAVIGYGGMGKWHCDKILKNATLQIAGVADISETRCELAKNNGLNVYETDDCVFADSDIDIVVVATPNDVHEELVIKALNSGKNVICEKPVTLSVASFDKMVAASEKSGKLLSVHQNRRWDSEYLLVKSVIEKKELGDVIRIEDRVQGSHGIPGDWRKEKRFGGGMLYDWGVHLIDQVMQLFCEKVVEVDCVNTHITNAEVDDGFRLELLFESGRSALVEVGTYNFLSLPRFYVQYEKGTLLIPDWNKNATVNKMTEWDAKNIVPVKTSAGITKTMAPRNPDSCQNYEIELPKSDVHDFYRNFIRAIDGEEEQAIKNCEVRRVLQVIEAAFLSDKTHQRIKVTI